MPTLAAIIAAHEAAQPTPVGTVLTDRGHTALAIIRLDEQLAALESADRACCLELLRMILDGADVSA